MAKYDLDSTEFNVRGARVGIVAARFNREIVSKLLAGALRALREHDIPDEDVELVRVPGAYEIPFATQALAQRGDLAVIITLGAVVRGGTPHFEYVAGEAARGITRTSLDEKIPVIFGVLTVDNMQQARDRTGGSEGDKGHESGLAALEMVTLCRQLKA